ncbi:MAG TPA: tetratricopeptide repeat protein, partial [Gemmataceae bacterium]
PEALPHLEQLRAEDPTNAEVLVGLAACWAVQLKGAEARQLLDGVLAGHPEDFAALLLYGEIEHQEERYAEAERWLRKALAVKPNDARARYALHLALQAQPNRQEEAAAERKRWESDRDTTLRLTNLLRAELANNPSDPELAAEAGELLLRLGEDQRGLYWLNAALKLNPSHVRSHRALLGYYERIHDAAHADEHRQFVPKQ